VAESLLLSLNSKYDNCLDMNGKSIIYEGERFELENSQKFCGGNLALLNCLNEGRLVRVIIKKPEKLETFKKQLWQLDQVVSKYCYLGLFSVRKMEINNELKMKWYLENV